MTDISRSLQNNSTAQKNTQIDADYLDRREQGKNIDLKQKVRRSTKALKNKAYTSLIYRSYKFEGSTGLHLYRSYNLICSVSQLKLYFFSF